MRFRPVLITAFLMSGGTVMGCVPAPNSGGNPVVVPVAADPNPVVNFDGSSERSEELPPPLLSEAGFDRVAYEQARDAGSNAALIFYLARHATSPYAPAARADLATRQSPDAAGAAAQVGGTDADIISAFDAARLSGPAALRAFIEAHGGHPLAGEAARLLRG
jgi:hypothetical protein